MFIVKQRKFSILLIAAFPFFFVSSPAFSTPPTHSSCSEIQKYADMAPAELEKELEELSNFRINQIAKMVDDCRKAVSAESVTTISTQEVKDKQESDLQKVEDATDQEKVVRNDIGGFNFAVGIGVIRPSGGNVNEAILDNGVVVVTDQEDQSLGFWLSTNTFLGDCWGTTALRCGAFLGVQVGGNNEVVNSLAVGLAISSSKSGSKTKGSSPLVFQLGWGWTRVQRLADGYVNGQPPPAGASQPLLTTTTEEGPVFLVSYNFL